MKNSFIVIVLFYFTPNFAQKFESSIHFGKNIQGFYKDIDQNAVLLATSNLNINLQFMYLVKNHRFGIAFSYDNFGRLGNPEFSEYFNNGIPIVNNRDSLRLIETPNYKIFNCNFIYGLNCKITKKIFIIPAILAGVSFISYPRIEPKLQITHYTPSYYIELQPYGISYSGRNDLAFTIGSEIQLNYQIDKIVGLGLIFGYRYVFNNDSKIFSNQRFSYRDNFNYFNLGIGAIFKFGNKKI